MIPSTLTQWIDANFSRPRVNQVSTCQILIRNTLPPSPGRVWLDACCEQLTKDQDINPLTSFAKFVDAIESQLLQSDLHDSMMHGTGLDIRVQNLTLVLLHSVTG